MVQITNGVIAGCQLGTHIGIFIFFLANVQPPALIRGTLGHTRDCVMPLTFCSYASFRHRGGRGYRTSLHACWT